MNEIYDAGEVVDRTLITKKALPYYSSPPQAGYIPKPAGTFPAGTAAGMVYSYLPVDPAKNRTTLWWMFYPGGLGGSYYYMPHHEGDFDIQSLRDQGAESEDEKNNPKEWYEKVLGQVLPVVVIAVLGAAAIKGYFARK